MINNAQAISDTMKKPKFCFLDISWILLYLALQYQVLPLRLQNNPILYFSITSRLNNAQQSPITPKFNSPAPTPS